MAAVINQIKSNQNKLNLISKSCIIIMVHSRLDYSSLVHGHTNIKRLQSVQNSAARVVLKETTTCHLPISWVNCTGYLFSPELSSSHTKYSPPASLHTWALCLIKFALYVQLLSTFCSIRVFPLSLPRGRSVISHLKFGTTYPSILGFALPYRPSNVISKRTYLWPLCVADADIIFLSRFYLFSSPNLSGRRLDVYHTSTHGVALVRI